jgi:hypothetical protein
LAVSVRVGGLVVLTMDSGNVVHAMLSSHWCLIGALAAGSSIMPPRTKQPAAKPKPETAGEYMQRVEKELLAEKLVRSGGRSKWRQVKVAYFRLT